MTLSRTPLVAAGLLAACALAACSAPAPAAEPSNDPWTPPASASASASGVAPGGSPLSGRADGAGRPVLVVKIDNTRQAQPQAGLRDADVVYVEEVEWGLTRLAAVFSSRLPDEVGPVRSARISDIELLGQYGRVAFAYSGAQAKLRPLLASADLYDVSADAGLSGYRRERDRRAPYNLMGDPARLLARAPRAAAARDVGFTFSDRPAAGGRAAAGVDAAWPSSKARFTWDAGAKGYTVAFGGVRSRAAEGGSQVATTVVVQYVTVRDSGFGDRYGGRTPLSVTTGTGAALVLRGGRAWTATWSRPTFADPTRFAGADGQPVPFAPGQVWVLLVNAESPATLR